MAGPVILSDINTGGHEILPILRAKSAPVLGRRKKINAFLLLWVIKIRNESHTMSAME
jgi:hypothetical protein